MSPPAAFWVVKCPDCSGEQTIFSRPSTPVSCSVCGASLATPTGGQAELRAEKVRTAGA
ncbi:MAG: 30S ribosomal protein S27e [Thermoplasmata archaeon]|nr:30S ribosomal protein S27e [Thermoplasmata archaeon]MCI4342049.1 30S ribosomal protein S27e [Thermoplasmata archaeon]